MISVIIPTLNDERRLTGCLAPLVPAAMDGLVRQLVIVDAGSADATLEIAEDAGADIVRSGEVMDGVTAARGAWLLFLDPGVRLEFGWEGAAKKHLERGRGAAAFHVEAGEGLIARLFPPPVAAHLIPKSEAGSLRLTTARGRLEARVGQHHRLYARARWSGRI